MTTKKATKKATTTNRLNGTGEVTGQSLTIAAPRIETAAFKIRGTAPYVSHKFSTKAREIMRSTQEAGSTAKKGRAKEAKDFTECYEGTIHRDATEGWAGIPAAAFRAGAISACRTIGFKMTVAKLSLFVRADGISAEGDPLVRITKGEPRMDVRPVRIQGTTTDLRARAMWDPGWEALLKVEYDRGQFTIDDVAHLLMRVGMQVGIGEGRPDSKTSCGVGWGTFELLSE